MAYIPLDDLEVYQLAMEIGEETWKIVDVWEQFEKNTVGKQFCEAADSIAANIAEGHGRFHFKENRNFCFYARGSLLETKSWLKKSYNRQLLHEDSFNHISDLLARCHLMLNRYIKSIGNSGNTLHEPEIVYYGIAFDDLPFNDEMTK